jgi:serine/threonine protein kinase
MALSQGNKLGPYEIIAPLGAGGMGEVYRAEDTRLDRTVAIKVLASHLSSSPELKQRFEREARSVSSLNPLAHLFRLRNRAAGSIRCAISRHRGEDPGIDDRRLAGAFQP